MNVSMRSGNSFLGNRSHINFKIDSSDRWINPSTVHLHHV